MTRPPSEVDPPPVGYEEFDRSIKNKNAEEVVTLLGQPDDSAQLPDGDEVWYYKDRTTNPVTLKPDSPQVIISNGRVKRINHW